MRIFGPRRTVSRDGCGPSGDDVSYDPGHATGGLCTGSVEGAVLLARRALEIIAVIDEPTAGPPRSTWIDDTLHDDRAPRDGWSVTEASEILRLNLVQDSREFGETEFTMSSEIDDGSLVVQIMSLDRRRDRSRDHQVRLGHHGFSLSSSAPDPIRPTLPARTGVRWRSAPPREVGVVAPSTLEYYRTLIDGTDQDESARATHDLGICFKNSGDHARARTHLEIALDSGHPEYGPRAMNNLGLLLEGQGLDQEAQSYYRRAIRSDNVDQSVSAMGHLRRFSR